MKIERITPGEAIAAAMTRRGDQVEGVEMHGYFTVQCIDKDGNVKWEDEIINLVTTQGKNSLLDKFLDRATAHTNCLMALCGAGTKAAGDTYASHAGWSEITAYTGNRPAVSFAAASAASKATSAVVPFPINGSATVAGCALMLSAGTTPGDTAAANAILYSAGDFSGGNRAVVSGDTLNVTYTATA